MKVMDDLIMVEWLIVRDGSSLGSKERRVVKESQDVGEVAVPFVCEEPKVCRGCGHFGWDDRTYITDKVIARRAE
jgi:hypothetical protein